MDLSTIVDNIAELMDTAIPAKSPYKTAFHKALSANVDPSSYANIMLIDCTTVSKASRASVPPLRPVFVSPVPPLSPLADFLS